MMKPTLSEQGYLRIKLYYEKGGRRTTPVHRLVAEAFVEKRPGADQVDHIDFVKNKNCAWNLEWVTPLENTRRAWKHLKIERKGTMNGRNKMSEKDVLWIRSFESWRLAANACAGKLGVCRNHVKAIYNRICWKHI